MVLPVQIFIYGYAKVVKAIYNPIDVPPISNFGVVACFNGMQKIK